VVDGNVTRVLCRLDAVDLTVLGVEAIWTRAAALVRGETPGDLNQALMELGAMVCTPTQPSCERCPLRVWCKALAQGDPEKYPPPKKRAAIKKLSVAFAWIESAAGVWLTQRPLDGLWAGLWEPPSAIGNRARELLADTLGVELEGPHARVRHQLTHREVRADVFLPVTKPRLRRTSGLEPVKEPLSAPVSALARKAIVAMLDRRR